MAASAFKAWVVCAPGLEGVLKQEIKQLLGFGRRKFLSPLLTGKHMKSRIKSKSKNNKKSTNDTASKGGAECWLSPEALAVVHTQSAVAESVRVRVGKPFRAKCWNELQKGVDELPLAAFLNKQQPVHVRVSASNSRLRHTGGIEERVRKVLSSKFGRGANVTTAAAAPSQSDDDNVADNSDAKEGLREPVSTTLYVQLLEDFCQISVDASGVGDRRLHARGFRTHVGRAPIRETLAAACWKATRQHMAELESGCISPTDPVHVWDPFCGSGTMLLEAYLHEVAVASEVLERADTNPTGCDHEDGQSTSSNGEVTHSTTSVFPPGMSRLLETRGPSPRETYPWQLWPNPQLGGLLQQFVSRRHTAIDALINHVAGVQSTKQTNDEASKFSKFTASDLYKKEVKAARHNTMSLRGLFMDFVAATAVALPSKPQMPAVPPSGSSQEQETGEGTIGDRTHVHDSVEVHSRDEWLSNIQRRIKQAFRRSFTFFEADCVEAAVKFQREHHDDSLPLIVFANLPYGQRSGLDKTSFQHFCASVGLSPDGRTDLTEANGCHRAPTESGATIPAAGVYVVTPLSAQQMKVFSGTSVPWKHVLQFRNGGVSVNLLAADIASTNKAEIVSS